MKISQAKHGSLLDSGLSRVVLWAPVIDHLVLSETTTFAQFTPSANGIVNDVVGGRTRPLLFCSWLHYHNHYPEVCLLTTGDENTDFQGRFDDAHHQRLELASEFIRFFALPLHDSPWHSSVVALRTDPPWHPQTTQYILAVLYEYRHDLGGPWAAADSAQTYNVSWTEMLRWRTKRHAILKRWSKSLAEDNELRERVSAEIEVCPAPFNFPN
jgi:hypothetical protein